MQISGKTAELLNEHGKKVYDWMNQKVSRIRMLQSWQASAGMSFVAHAHHRVAHCFITDGNKHHADKSGTAVSLQEWQAAIGKRHALGHSGLGAEPADAANDYS